MGKRASRRTRNSKQFSNENNPFTGHCVGNFDSIVSVHDIRDVALKGVQVGAQVTKDAQKSEEAHIPKWQIIIYCIILAFAFLVLFVPFLQDYKQYAIGYIFGQGPLILKSKI